MSVVSTKPNDANHQGRLNVLEDNDVDRGDGASIFKNRHIAVDKTIHQDFHSALTELKADPTKYIWSTLHDHTDAMYKALSRLPRNYGNAADVRSAARHVYQENRVYALILTEQKLLEEFETFKDTSILANLICTNNEFRMIYAIWRWCQEGAVHEPKGFADLAHEYNSMADIRNIRSNTLRNLSMGQQGLGIDMDAKCSDDDAELSARLTRVVFSLVRCGQIENAIELYSAVGVPALASHLRMYQFLTDPSLSPSDPLSSKFGGPKRRHLYLTTLHKLIENKSTSPYDRMLYCALSGRSEPLLSMATRTVDRLWCMANAAITNIFQETVTNKVLENVPRCVDSIFGKIVETTHEPYYMVFGVLLCRQWAYLIDYIVGLVQKLDPVDSQIIRFTGNMVAIARLLGYEHDEPGSYPLLAALMDRLCNKELFHLVPFYAALLPRSMAEQHLLQIMKLIGSEDDRSAYLIALEQAGFDRDYLATLSAENHEETALSADHRIDRLRWLLLNQDRTLDQTIKQANNLVRHFMIADDDDSARRVLAEMAHFNIPQTFDELMKHSSTSRDLRSFAAEYEAHQLFFDAFTACEKFAEVAVQNREGERQSSAATSRATHSAGLNLTQSTEKAVEERKRDSENKRLKTTIIIYRQKALQICEKFMRHGGWQPAGETDAFRRHQLTLLRARCGRTLLELLIGANHAVGDAEAVLKVSVLMADPELMIETLLSKMTPDRLVEMIHRYGGLAPST